MIFQTKTKFYNKNNISMIFKKVLFDHFHSILISSLIFRDFSILFMSSLFNIFWKLAWTVYSNLETSLSQSSLFLTTILHSAAPTFTTHPSFCFKNFVFQFYRCIFFHSNLADEIHNFNYQGVDKGRHVFFNVVPSDNDKLFSITNFYQKFF